MTFPVRISVGERQDPNIPVSSSLIQSESPNCCAAKEKVGVSKNPINTTEKRLRKNLKFIE